MSKLELCSGFVLNIGRFYLLEFTKLRLQDAMIVTWEGLFQCLPVTYFGLVFTCKFNCHIYFFINKMTVTMKSCSGENARLYCVESLNQKCF